MRVLGAQSSFPEGLDPVETVSNYFIGSNPSHWHAGIRNYARVCYRGIRPGIDLYYYGTGGRLEYDLVVAPEADISGIALAFDGVESTRIGPAGDLILRTAAGELRQARPRLYQFQGGRKLAVEGRYRLVGQNRVGFGLGSYDRTRALVIDPVLTYSTYVGGNGWDEGVGMALDASNNVYVAGWTTSTNLSTDGALGKSGGRPVYTDAFVFKLNATGTKLLYCTYLGGSSYDDAWSVAVDPAGNAYVTGATTSVDFPVTSNGLQRKLAGDAAAFVTKLDPSGTKLIYSTYLGGDGVDKGLGIAIDKSGNAHITGRTTSSNFPTSTAAFQKSNLGKDDIFVTKLDPSGASFIYSTLIGGPGADWANAIALDSAGAAYLTGYTQSATFPTTPNAAQPTFYGGPGDGFVTKLNPTGTGLVYSTFLGGRQDDFARARRVFR
jgi:hypothetical protein